MKHGITMPYDKKMPMPIKSDFYFNNPEEVEEMKEYSDVYPVDNLGFCVPEGKSIDNLKKMEHSIRSEYPLGGEH